MRANDEPFATVADISLLWRPLTQDEETRAAALLPLLSDMLRDTAHKIGKDMDEMIDADPNYESVAKLVTVDIVARVLRQSTTGDPMSQESQSGLGYSWSGTYAVPGGGIAAAIMNNDLKRLGLLQQQMDSIILWGSEPESAPKVPQPGQKVNVIGRTTDDSNIIGEG